jgi:hypothetical protein
MRQRNGRLSAPLIAGAAMAVFALWTQLSAPIGSAAPPYVWLFAPGRFASVLVRHGGPVWLQALGALVAIGLFWGAATDLALTAVARWRRPRANAT